MRAPGFQYARLFQDGLQGRDVLTDELFLEVDGVGGYHHPLASGDGEEGRREQVGQRLADAGAALDDQVMLVVDGAGDRVQHFLLFGAMLKAAEHLGEWASRAEHTVDVVPGDVAQTFVLAASPYAATGQAFRGLQTLRQLRVVQAGRPYRR